MLSTILDMAGNPIQIANSGAALAITWSDDHTSRFNVKWLRFHCQCERCKPQFADTFALDRAAFEDDMKLTSYKIHDGEFQCSFDKDILADHVTKIHLDFLLTNCNCDSCLEKEIKRRDYGRKTPSDGLPVVDQKDILSDSAIFECLEKIINFGFCIVSNFETSEKKKVEKFVRSIGPVRFTGYNDFWNVRNKVDPINAAYTNHGLPFHQDEQLYETPPGVQFLAAVKFDESVKGGESKLVDMLRCAEILRDEYPEHFKTLCRVPARFHSKDMKRKRPIWYEHWKPHIELDYFGKIVSVHWHPAQADLLKVREEDVDLYYRAHRIFDHIINRDEYQFVFRLKTGDILVMNNHRMAHSRNAFSATKDGDRHLLGCYIDIDDLKCRYMILAKKLGIDVVPPKVGNRSSF